MISFIRKHWGNLAFALASFFWTGCTDDAQPVYGVVQVPNESSSSMSGDCPECEYGVPSVHSSSSVESSSSVVSSSSEGIPRMSATEYGIMPINCYTTSVKAGSSYTIFECDNGKRYLKDYRKYSDELRSILPNDILWSEPREGTEGQNCNFNGPPLCVDKVDSQGRRVGGCRRTIECPSKPSEN